MLSLNDLCFFFNVQLRFSDALQFIMIAMFSMTIRNRILQQIIMAQYNITKIIDGLFVSDYLVPMDANFLVGNKVIRLLGWTNYIQHHQIEQQNIFEFHFTKNERQVKFPPWNQLQKGFSFLEVIHQQMLCGLIYSQTQLQSSLICIMYLMYKFHWNFQTSYNFIRNKLEMFQFSDQAQEELEHYQKILEIQLAIKLKNIIWEYDYLVNYKPETDQQALIVNTFKNKMRKFNPTVDNVNRQIKKPRIKWYDQVRPSSAKYINLHKGSRLSINKPKINSPTTQISIFQDLSNSTRGLQFLQQSLPPKVTITRVASQKKQSNWDEDSEYLQLKEMSRTNFNDKKYMTSQIRRRGSLKSFKDKTSKMSLNNSQNTSSNQNNLSVNNLNSILGIYSNSNTKIATKGKTSLTKTNAQSFLNNLKSFNKTGFSNS